MCVYIYKAHRTLLITWGMISCTALFTTFIYKHFHSKRSRKKGEKNTILKKWLTTKEDHISGCFDSFFLSSSRVTLLLESQDFFHTWHVTCSVTETVKCKLKYKFQFIYMHTIPMWRSEHALIFQMKISLGMYECVVGWGWGGGRWRCVSVGMMVCVCVCVCVRVWKREGETNRIKTMPAL